MASARGEARSGRGVPLADLRRTHAALRTRLQENLEGVEVAALGADDRRAMATMQRQLAASTDVEQAPAPPGATPSCDAAPAGDIEGAALRAHLYACFGHVAGQLVTPIDTTDRLTVLSRLALEPDSARRRALFLSLRPLWRVVAGDGGQASPYRRLMTDAAQRQRGEGGGPAAAARALGLDPATVEPVLRRILAAWRDASPDARLEPWDWYYAQGAASRALSPRLPREALRTVNDAYFRDQGADPTGLGIRYDLEPRAGKVPVAFTQFGRLPRPARGRRERPVTGEPWVVATYREGGFDNLVELLHETGHALHVRAVSARPAFADWPDADAFTEALGDLPALEAYDPAWQRRYLGAAADAEASHRAQYAAIVLDVAWALLEVRLLADAGRDATDEWTAITGEYLRIAPHPEWPWWAMRGQLVESPGYMLHYALGAMVAAQLREAVRAARGPFATPDRGRYRWLSEHLYRFGLARPSREVLRDVTGRPLDEGALVRDLRRRGGP